MKKVKQKTRKSATKRFKVTGSGKLMRRRGFSRHLRVKRSASKKRGQKRAVEVTGFYEKKLRKRMGLKKKK